MTLQCDLRVTLQRCCASPQPLLPEKVLHACCALVLRPRQVFLFAVLGLEPAALSQPLRLYLARAWAWARSLGSEWNTTPSDWNHWQVWKSKTSLGDFFERFGGGCLSATACPTFQSWPSYERRGPASAPRTTCPSTVIFTQKRSKRL